MLINPYDTAIGIHVNTKKLETTLSEFLIKGQDTRNLNYEYRNINDIEIIFITGKNEDEVELPVWNHPLFINDFRGKNKIFVDLRSMVRIKNTDFLNLSEIVNNTTGFEFTITRVIYMAHCFSDRVAIGEIQNGIAMSFSKWISSSFKSSLSLGVEDVIKLEVITLYYILYKLNDEEVNDKTSENIMFKITTILRVLRGNLKYVKSVCEGINYNPKDAVDLIDNIKLAVDTPLMRDISTSLLYNIIGSTWNGINAAENVAMSMEHIPTLVGVIYTSINSKSLKHSKLANILNNNNRLIGADDIVKKISLVIEEDMV